MGSWREPVHDTQDHGREWQEERKEQQQHWCPRGWWYILHPHHHHHPRNTTTTRRRDDRVCIKVTHQHTHTPCTHHSPPIPASLHHEHSTGGTWRAKEVGGERHSRTPRLTYHSPSGCSVLDQPLDRHAYCSNELARVRYHPGEGGGAVDARAGGGGRGVHLSG